MAACPRCTAEVRPGARFCRTCGLEQAPAAAGRALPGLGAAPQTVRVEVEPEPSDRGRRPSPLVVGGAVAAVVLVLALVIGLVAAGGDGDGDDGGGGSGSGGGGISTSAELAAPTGVAVAPGSEGCEAGAEQCSVAVTFIDESDGETSHELVRTVGREEPDEAVLAPEGAGTGETVEMEASVAVDAPSCLTLQAVAGGQRSDPSDPVCVLATSDGQLLGEDQYAAAWQLADGECVNPLPGRAWDGEGASSYLLRAECGFLAGTVFHVEAPHSGAGADVCRQNSQTGLPDTFSSLVTENADGDDVLTCIAHQ
jgi:hypothetical protein